MRSSNNNILETTARFGYGARGAVYCLVGGLALLAAIGSGGQTGGSESALRTLLEQPFGKIVLGIVALGLAAFAVWRFIEAITDADRRGNSGKGLGVRAAHILSGFAYSALAVSTIGLALGMSSGSSGEDRAAQDWTAWLMAMPLGPWLVGGVGVGVAAAGLGFLWKGWRGDVSAYLSLDPGVRRWAVPLGRVGYGARGVVFALIGMFLVLAAFHGNSAEAKGLGGAMKSLESQPYGWVLLGLTAAGLFAFGVFGFVQARYRRIDAPDMDSAADAATAQLRSLTS